MTNSTNQVKRGYTSIMLVQAINRVEAASGWAKQKNFAGEVSECIVAQLLMGISLESAINEVCDTLLPKSAWAGLEKADVQTKWYIASGINGKTPFDFGAEPIQTVSEMSKKRNALAHPKGFKFENQIVLQDSDGTVHRNVPPDSLVKPGQSLITGALALHEKEEFNLAKTTTLLERTIAAIIKLTEHLETNELGYIHSIRVNFERMKSLEGL